LAQGWRQWATDNQPWKDSLETVSWQGFEQEDDLIGFWGNETTIFLNDEIASSRVDDSQTGFKGRRNPQNDNLVQNPAWKCNPNKKPSHEDSNVVTRLREGASLLEAV
jgi:hypothetical protein